MDSPYRSPPSRSTPGPARDTGLVGEVIGQFADPLALYRELVQNSIDAGTPSIEIEQGYDDGEQAARIVVRDAGEGMDRDILENRLVVLFRSTKENDSTKIGKFGIGFASVLAIGPRAVIVRTARGGRRHILHLYPDLSYELFDGGPATRGGTTVELLVPKTPEEIAELARASEQALVKWCRHASVPITFKATGPGGAPLADTRIDRPLAIDGALIQIEGRSEDGATTVVVGITRLGMPYTGFFNHGLMLQEQNQSLVGSLSIKIQDSRLGHTISRDSVRRDDAHERAVETARAVATRKLPAAAAAALREAAGADDLAGYHALLDGLLRSELEIDRDSWVIPLIEPVAGNKLATLAGLARQPRWTATHPSPLTAALAAAGVPVIDFRSQPAGGYASRLARLLPGALVAVHDELTLVTPVESTGVDRALADELALALAAARARTAAIQWVTLSGAMDHLPVLHGVRDIAAPSVIGRDHALRPPFARLLMRPIALNVDNVRVKAAREAAVTDPVAAGALLARLVLLQYHRLDPHSSERVFDHVVQRLLGGNTT